MKRISIVLLLGLVLTLAAIILYSQEDLTKEMPWLRSKSACNVLNETLCTKSTKCRAVYSYVERSTCPKGEICPTVIYPLIKDEFLYCEKIPDDDLVQAKKDKELCVGEYADWSEISKPGRCSCFDKDSSREKLEQQGQVNFVAGYGCITGRELCEKLNGDFESDPSNAYEYCTYPDGSREHVWFNEDIEVRY